ncbi:MAG: hypothetical protein ACKOTF_18455 [Opitutaceae bacterium]
MDAAPPRRPLWLRLLRATGIFLAILLAALAMRIVYTFRDRSPGYTVRVSVSSGKSQAEPRPLRAGFARERINPKLGDPARPVYLAGFSQNRTATAIHDDLWSVACVIDDGHTRVGFVALDSIGLFHDDVVEIRRRLGPELGLANDEVGYIIPRSEWDRMPPYLYDSAKSVYGEVNSLGPETAPRLHAAWRDLSVALR